MLGAEKAYAKLEQKLQRYAYNSEEKLLKRFDLILSERKIQCLERSFRR